MRQSVEERRGRSGETKERGAIRSKASQHETASVFPLMVLTVTLIFTVSRSTHHHSRILCKGFFVPLGPTPATILSSSPFHLRAPIREFGIAISRL
jgi:hypothetical protein